MERYAAGDEAAFEELYDLIAPRLLGFIIQRVRDLPTAQDLLQQTLLQIHLARSSFITGAEVMPWVFAIARHLVIDAARCHRSCVPIGADLINELSGSLDGADQIVEAHELVQRIEGELARMPPQQRRAFELHKRHGLSLVAAAQTLQISVGALKVRVHRARRTLEAALFPSEELSKEAV